MKTSTPTQPKKVDPLSILLIGPPGGAKTTLAMQFPSVCFLDLDSFLDGPELFVRSKRKDLSYSFDNVLRDDTGKVLPLEKCYDMLVQKMTALVDNTEIKTVVIDSLTLLDEIIVTKILKEQRKSVFEIQHYNNLRSDLLHILIGRIRALNRTTISIVHEKDKEETDKSNIMIKHIVGHDPLLRGSVGKSIGAFHTDVWRCSSKPGIGNSVEYSLQVTKTSKDDDLKNSLGFPPEGFVVKHGELMFSKIEPYLKGRI